MTDDAVPQWPDEAVAESFRREILARFEAHNAAFRAREAIDLEAVLREHPGKRGQPGYEIRDSGAWEIYQAADIRIDRNSVVVVLPKMYAISMDLVHLFDNTTVAWSRPSIGATIVDGEARVTIEITLVATWTDAMQEAWKREGNDRKQVLAELYEDDVRWLLGLVCAHEDRQALRARLELSLEALP